jgi:hypothetical protein
MAKYDPAKDPKLGEAKAKVDGILADEFLPLEVQVQRIAWLRRYLQEKIRELKQGME